MLEFNKKAFVKQILFLSKQNCLIAHALGGFDTVRRMLASGVAYECHTTWHAGLFSMDDLLALADTLADAGVAHWTLQECRTLGAGRGHLGLDGWAGGAAGSEVCGIGGSTGVRGWGRGWPANALGQASVSDCSRLLAVL